MEVVVEFEYVSLHEDELTLRLGDIIKNARHIGEEGWMEGDLNGKRGLFPDNFVKEVKKDAKETQTKNEVKEEPATQQPLSQKRDKSAGNVANLVHRMSAIGIPTGGFQPHAPPPAQPQGHPPVPRKKPKKRQCKALFVYLPQNEDELELKIGDIIDIIEEVEEGWWNGSMNGKSGLFPSNFVKELEASGEDGEPGDTIADETDGSGKDGVTSPTSPNPSPGNGVIAQPKKVRGVGFGDIFREGSVKLRVRLPSPDKEEKKDKPIPSLPSAAKPALPNTPELPRPDGDCKSKAKEYCKVIFAFDSTNEDELCLKEGDVIHILSKDTGEPGWWRGETSGGKEGVFPDNFVTVITEMDKEAPTQRGSVKLSPKQDTEEKPKKPPPPSKSVAIKPEVPSADKKPHLARQEDKVDKVVPDHKPSKPAAPVVPPKKPVPPPGKGRPGSFPPKRPDKPLNPSPSLKHNGEVPSLRPKSEVEPMLPTKPKTLSGDWGEKAPDMDLMSFDDLSSTSEKLSHPTANRPKMPGRRLPAQFGGHSPNKDMNVEKSFKVEEEDIAKPKLPETKKPSANTITLSPSFLKPIVVAAEPKPSPLAPTPAPTPVPTASPDIPSTLSSTDGPAQGSKTRPEPEEQMSPMEEMQNQMKDLELSVELLKTQHMKEIGELRKELDDERQKRVALQMEIEKLKRIVQST